jgi:hypothetical protein
VIAGTQVATLGSVTGSGSGTSRSVGDDRVVFQTQTAGALECPASKVRVLGDESCGASSDQEGGVMICSICGEYILDDPWFQLLVHEGAQPGDVVYGSACSLSCLTDYVARVHAMELSDAD